MYSVIKNNYEKGTKNIPFSYIKKMTEKQSIDFVELLDIINE